MSVSVFVQGTVAGPDGCALQTMGMWLVSWQSESSCLGEVILGHLWGVLPEDQMLDLIRTEYPTAGAVGWVWDTRQGIVDRLGGKNPGRPVTVIPRAARG